MQKTKQIKFPFQPKNTSKWITVLTYYTFRLCFSFSLISLLRKDTLKSSLICSQFNTSTILILTSFHSFIQSNSLSPPLCFITSNSTSTPSLFILRSIQKRINSLLKPSLSAWNSKSKSKSLVFFRHKWVIEYVHSEGRSEKQNEETLLYFPVRNRKENKTERARSNKEKKRFKIKHSFLTLPGGRISVKQLATHWLILTRVRVHLSMSLFPNVGDLTFTIRRLQGPPPTPLDSSVFGENWAAELLSPESAFTFPLLVSPLNFKLRSTSVTLTPTSPCPFTFLCKLERDIRLPDEFPIRPFPPFSDPDWDGNSGSPWLEDWDFPGIIGPSNFDKVWPSPKLLSCEDELTWTWIWRQMKVKNRKERDPFILPSCGDFLYWSLSLVLRNHSREVCKLVQDGKVQVLFLPLLLLGFLLFNHGLASKGDETGNKRI